MRHLQIIRGILLALFFVSTLMLSLPFSNALFVSPDENAAFVFAWQLSETGSVEIPEPLNTELRGLLHPRSAIGFGDAILPASFLGFLIILAGVGSIFGVIGMHLVTPVLAVIAVVLWRGVVRRLLDDSFLADAAAFFLLIHPAFWYYSGRVMMHNVAFLTFLIAAAWFVLVRPFFSHARKERRASARLLDYMLGGLMLGLALFVRTYEVIWIAIAIASLFVIYRGSIGWRAMISFASGVAIVMIALAGVQTLVFGDPLTSGYNAQYAYESPEVAEVADEIENTESGKRINPLLPFGFHERVILGNVVNYGFRLYPWMSVLAIAGIVLVLAKNEARSRVWMTMIVLTLALATWMGIVYGSWRIIDNPDPDVVSLGNSHVRYWLPLFALASLFAARALKYVLGDKPMLIEKGNTEALLRHAFGATLTVVAALLSLNLVFFGADGFMPSRAALATFDEKRSAILEVTEDDAIIVVDRADKYLFPHRRVVVPLRSEYTYAALPKMTELAPVYYFGITLPEKDLEYLNTQKLPPLGVQIEYVATIQEESLYRFTRRDVAE